MFFGEHMTANVLFYICIPTHIGVYMYAHTRTHTHTHTHTQNLTHFIVYKGLPRPLGYLNLTTL